MKIIVHKRILNENEIVLAWRFLEKISLTEIDMCMADLFDVEDSV